MKPYQLLKKLITYNLKPITSDQNQEVFKMKPSAIFKVPLIFNLKPLTLISKRRKAMKSVRSLGVQHCLKPLVLTHLSFLTVMMLFLFLNGIPANAGPKSEGAEEAIRFAPGVLMLKFSEGVKVEMEKREGYVATAIPSIDALNRKYGVIEFTKIFSLEPKSEKGRTAYRELGLDRVYRFVTLPEADVQAMVAEYEADPNVESAEPDYVGHGHFTPNDPSFGVQWGLHNTGSNPPPHPGTFDADIDATEAWEFWSPEHVIILAILDTGVDLDHPDLGDVIWQNTAECSGISGVDDDGNGFVDDCYGYDFVNDDGNPQDDHGHGTVNAGIAGAITNNNLGVAGLVGGPYNPQRIMAVKVLDNNCWGLYSWWEIGLIYAVINGASVINMSMGGYDYSEYLEEIVTWAWSEGCVIVASMGNDNSSTPQYPAKFYATIAVGATDTDDSRCVPEDWEPFDMPDGGSNYGSHIHVVAPGNWIYSTVWNNTYDYWAGTSMAAPFVSGLAAMIMSEVWPEPHPEWVDYIIYSTADDQVGPSSEDAPGWDQYYGYGRINACRALGGSSRGDVNGDGTINVTDVVYLINYLFNEYSPPDPLWLGDANGDGKVNVVDVVYLINYLFGEGPPPPCGGKATTSLGSGLELYKGKAPAQIGFSSPAISKDGIFEVPVTGKFDVDVAAVQLEIKYDPEKITLSEPALTPRTEGLTIYSSSNQGIQKIGSLRSLQVGILDLSGEHYISAGTGALVNLRIKGSDLSSLEITKAICASRDAREIPVQIVSEMKKSEEDITAEKSAIPQEFSLSQNYPNPFNPETEIKYALSQDCDVKLIIYNILGEKVKLLVDEHQTAGHKTIHWNGRDEKGKEIASGIYFYKILAGDFSQSRKMVLVK